MLHRVALAVALGTLAAASAARAEDGLGPLTGRVMPYLRVPVEDIEKAPLQQASVSVWLELKPRLGPSYASFVGIGDAYAASITGGGGTALRLRLREGYVGIGNETIDFRIGYQVIPWGNADGVNPTDFLSARDLTYFSTDTEANRLGALCARLRISPLTWFSVETVATPITPVTTLLVPAALLPPGYSSVPTSQPVANLRNIELGGRVTFNTRRFDLSLIGFRGFNHTPELELRGQRPDGSVDVAFVQHAWLAAGLNSSLAAGGFVFRLETAYVSTKNDNGKNPLIQPTHWDGVLGLERSFLSQTLRIQLQGIARVHPAYTPPSAVRGPDSTTPGVPGAIAATNAILQNYTQQVRVAASLRAAYATSDEKFMIEVFGVLNLVDEHDFFIRPLVGYRPTDALRLEVGAEIYGGPKNTQLGALAPFNGIFTQGTYVF